MLCIELYCNVCNIYIFYIISLYRLEQLRVTEAKKRMVTSGYYTVSCRVVKSNKIVTYRGIVHLY